MAARTRRSPAAKRPRRLAARPRAPRKPRRPVRAHAAAAPQVLQAAPLPRSLRFVSTVFVVAGFASLVAVLLGTLLVSNRITLGGDDRLRVGLAVGALVAVPFDGLAIVAGIDLARGARWAWRTALALCALGLFLVLLGTFGMLLSQAWRTAEDLGPPWFQVAGVAAGAVAAAFFGWALLALSEPGTALRFRGHKTSYQQP